MDLLRLKPTRSVLLDGVIKGKQTVSMLTLAVTTRGQQQLIEVTFEYLTALALYSVKKPHLPSTLVVVLALR